MEESQEMDSILSSLKAYGIKRDSSKDSRSDNPMIYKQLKFAKVYKNMPQLWIKLVSWPTLLDKENTNILIRQSILFLELM